MTLYEDNALPTMVQVGDTVELACNFVLDGARRGESSLYSVKWYRDNVEFFRYVVMIEIIGSDRNSRSHNVCPSVWHRSVCLSAVSHLVGA